MRKVAFFLMRSLLTRTIIQSSGCGFGLVPRLDVPETDTRIASLLIAAPAQNNVIHQFIMASNTLIMQKVTTRKSALTCQE